MDEISQLKDKRNFLISMENIFFNQNGENKRTYLQSRFTREVIDRPHDNIAFCRYKLNRTKFSSNQKDIEWSFAKDFTFYHVLYSLKDDESRKKLIKLGKESQPIESINDSFKNLPKLPSVYLLMMQVYDIIGLDSFTSFINSHQLEIFEPKLIKDFSFNEVDMDISNGTGKASFEQNKFFLEFLAKTNEYCVYEYRSEASLISFSYDRTKENKNESIYQGHIVIDNNDQDIIKGTMYEVVIPRDSREMVKQRIIRMERLEDRNERD